MLKDDNSNVAHTEGHMRNVFLGFLCGIFLSGTVWAGASTIYPSPAPQSRPDQLWEHDRGAAITQYQQQRQQEILQEQQLRSLQREAELKHRPC